MDPRPHPQAMALATALAQHRPSGFSDERDRFAAGKRSQIAAVAALVRPSSGTELELLLIRRAEREGDVWSGHVALPGGRREPDDVDALHTARRETLEEVGIDLQRCGTPLGPLPVLTPRSQMLPTIAVHPFVWLVGEARAQLSDEVAAVRWVSLDHLRSADHQIEHRLLMPSGEERTFAAISVGEDVLWGMTHRIVLTLLEALDGRPAG